MVVPARFFFFSKSNLKGCMTHVTAWLCKWFQLYKYVPNKLNKQTALNFQTSQNHNFSYNAVLLGKKPGKHLL